MKIEANSHYDCVIIGGGINGAAIAADAAGRGLNVFLCEQNDLGSATSSWSTKLIHGGLRYLESYDFKLVRHALIERTRLINRASFLVRPLPFIIPHQRHLRPKWMIRAGLFLYDHLAKRGSVPASSSVTLDHNDPHQPLRTGLDHGFQYYDCQTDDHRLVILNALNAAQHGAEIRSHCQFQQASIKNSRWQITLKENDCLNTITADALINAAGPWVNRVLDQQITLPTQDRVTLIQGSHIVVKQHYPQAHAYLLQNPDGRIIFTIPYEQDYTLIGTTDTPFTGDPATASVSDDEVNYLLSTTNHFFQKQLQRQDIVWQYSGVRALYNPDQADPSKITREYHLSLNDSGGAPLLSVLGGKLTTHRQLAEDAVDLLQPHFASMGACQTTTQALPGGDLGGLSDSAFCQQCKAQFSHLDEALVEQYFFRYGSRILQLLQDCDQQDDLGQRFSATLYAREIDFMLENEWATCAEDVLWRRSKHGLRMTPSECDAVAQYIAAQQHRQ